MKRFFARLRVKTALSVVLAAGIILSVAGFPGNSFAEKNEKKIFKKICAEEHFSTNDHINLLEAIYLKKYPSAEVVSQEKYIQSDAPFIDNLNTPGTHSMIERLNDLGTLRLGDMDKYKIDVQILSLVSPGVQVFEPKVATQLARKYNDILAEAIRKNPKRYIGLATVAPQDPAAAADEVERAVTKLGFKGIIINSHTKGEYLDDKKYWVIFERAQKLGVPVYLHPRAPSPDMMKPYLGYPMLDSAMWGFTAEAGLHAMRLISSGLFDEYPNLKIILGHMGETIPSLLERIDNRYSIVPLKKKLKKLPGQYFKDNFFVTTSGMTSLAVLNMTISILGADKILFAVDYPMEDAEEVVNFIDNAPISDIDKEKICHINAEKLFSVK